MITPLAFSSIPGRKALSRQTGASRLPRMVGFPIFGGKGCKAAAGRFRGTEVIDQDIQFAEMLFYFRYDGCYSGGLAQIGSDKMQVFVGLPR